MYTIKDNIFRMEALTKQIKETTPVEELVTYQGKFNAIAYDLQLAVGEACITINSGLFDIKYENIMNFIDNAQRAENYDEFKSAVANIVAEFEGFQYSDYTVSSYREKAARFAQLHRTKSKYTIDNMRPLYKFIQEHIKVPVNRDVTLFYPDCDNAENVVPFNQIDRLLAYGNEDYDSALYEAKKRMHKVVKGGLKGSRIQNKAFDLLFCDPIIGTDVSEDKFVTKRPEKGYILDMVKYLRDDGVIIIAIPYTRLYKDVCGTISRQFKNITVFKANDRDFHDLGLVYVVGQKEYAKDGRPDEYNKLRALYDKSRIKDLQEIDCCDYVLPRGNTVIDIFKGSSLDLEEVESIIDTSGLMDKIWKSQAVERLGDSDKSPLLPFNIGQLGLVLTSGCLDGVVDEGDGYKHLIKGRVSKYTQEVEETTAKGVEVTETTVNKVEINVLLPNGEFKVLA